MPITTRNRHTPGDPLVEVLPRFSALLAERGLSYRDVERLTRDIYGEKGKVDHSTAHRVAQQSRGELAGKCGRDIAVKLAAALDVPLGQLFAREPVEGLA